jgi:hypothetical protein
MFTGPQIHITLTEPVITITLIFRTNNTTEFPECKTDILHDSVIRLPKCNAYEIFLLELLVFVIFLCSYNAMSTLRHISNK